MRYSEIVCEGEVAPAILKPVVLPKDVDIRLSDGSIGHFSFNDDGETRITAECTIGGEYAGVSFFDLNRVGDEPWDAKYIGSYSSSTVNVNTEFRRRGIARTIYTLMANAGFKIIASGKFGGKLSPDGHSLWNSIQKPWEFGRRRPSRVEFWPKGKLGIVKPPRMPKKAG